MPEKQRINTRYECDRKEDTAVYAKNDIYRKFSKQFDKLFDAEETPKTFEELQEIYVNDEPFEADIEDFRNSFSNSIKYCVGYTGMGKSTSINYCFKILQTDRNAKFIKARRELLFPVMLDAYKKKQKNNDPEAINLTDRIAAACTYMLKTFPDTAAYLRTDEGKRELYDFILVHTPFALETSKKTSESAFNPVDALDMDETELIKAKLKHAYNENPYEYYANELKFIIKKHYDKISNLIIILDDIESFDDESQLEIISEFQKFKECMENTDPPEGTNAHKYFVKLLVSLRPDTLRRLQRNRRLETFSKNNPGIQKRNAVELDTFFKKRFDYYTKTYASEIGNMDTWKECYQNLIALNSKFGGQYKEMIQNLCFYDIRKALAVYSDIFSNRYYIQGNKKREDVFTVTKDEYTFDNITVIRAISCHENVVYFGDSPSCLIPNIFLTTINDDLSIECLLVMQYFKLRLTTEPYGVDAERFADTYAIWKSIFGESLTGRFKTALDHLFVLKVLRKSILDQDDAKTRDTPEAIGDDTHLYLSPMGSEVYKMLQRDSVTLELLREAAWRDYTGRDYSDRPSSELIVSSSRHHSRQYIIFNDLLNYISYLSELEEEIIGTVHTRDKMDDYLSCFGNETVSSMLLTGVRNSIEYSWVYNDHPELSTVFRDVYNKVLHLKGRLSLKKKT